MAKGERTAEDSGWRNIVGVTKMDFIKSSFKPVLFCI